MTLESQVKGQFYFIKNDLFRKESRNGLKVCFERSRVLEIVPNSSLDRRIESTSNKLLIS